MTKTITYVSLATSCILVVLLFITSKTYAQLGIAIVLYPALAYFILKVLPQDVPVTPAVTVELPPKVLEKAEESKLEKVEVVADLDKRTFLKLIGAAGLSFFVFSILGRRVDSLLFGNSLNSGSGSNGVPAGNLNSQAPQLAEGFKISEIDDSGAVSYYGFVNQKGGWLIMRQDSDTSSFRYAKGDSNFADNWSNRENVKYDYYSKLF